MASRNTFDKTREVVGLIDKNREGVELVEHSVSSIKASSAAAFSEYSRSGGVGFYVSRQMESGVDSSILILSDSTCSSDSQWGFLFARELGVKFGCRVVYRSANQGVLSEARVIHDPAGWLCTLYVDNASEPGNSVSDFFGKMSTQISKKYECVLCSLGHNGSQNVSRENKYAMALSLFNFTRSIDNNETVCLLQNLDTSSMADSVEVAEIMSLVAKDFGVPVVDVRSEFLRLKRAGVLGGYMLDQVHPSANGQVLYVNALLSAFSNPYKYASVSSGSKEIVSYSKNHDFSVRDNTTGLPEEWEFVNCSVAYSDSGMVVQSSGGFSWLRQKILSSGKKLVAFKCSVSAGADEHSGTTVNVGGRAYKNPFFEKELSKSGEQHWRVLCVDVNYGEKLGVYVGNEGSVLTISKIVVVDFDQSAIIFDDVKSVCSGNIYQSVALGVGATSIEVGSGEIRVLSSAEPSPRFLLEMKRLMVGERYRVDLGGVPVAVYTRDYGGAVGGGLVEHNEGVLEFVAFSEHMNLLVFCAEGDVYRPWVTK